MWSENSKTLVPEFSGEIETMNHGTNTTESTRKTSVFTTAKGVGVPKVFGGHCLFDLIQVTIVCQVPYSTSAFEASRVSTCYDMKMIVNGSSKL